MDDRPNLHAVTCPCVDGQCREARRVHKVARNEKSRGNLTFSFMSE